MSQENVEVMRQVMTALAAGDVERLVDLTDPEIEWITFFSPRERLTRSYGQR